MRKRVPRVGNRRAAEIQRIAVFVERNFHDVRVGKVRRIIEPAARGRDRGVGMVGKLLRDAADQCGLDQRLVALHVDDDALRE